MNVKKTLIILLIIIAIGLGGFFGILYWHKHTVNKNSELCLQGANVLLKQSEIPISTYCEQNMLLSPDLTEHQLQLIDKNLQEITKKSLQKLKGTEGGFYIKSCDRFIGYSYPTSPPPIPAYGPPPRSYLIIKGQCEETYQKNKQILNLHEFDPAYFPLTTVPILCNKQVIGAIWVRIHIERELPLVKLRNVILVVLIALVIILLIIIAFFYRMQQHIQTIQSELQIVWTNPDYQLQYNGKLFQGIKNAINHTLTELQNGNKKRTELENKLIQKEKMASIGRIVAGVAHEVRTPLAIIKTRIQMWQMLLKNGKLFDNNSDLFNDKAMKLVINEADRLSDLTKRLLMFSKPIGNKLLVNLNYLVLDVVKIIEIKSNRTDIKFDVKTKEIPNIKIDKNAIQQVLINVISNAVEAMPQGGIIKIITDICENKTAVCITIEDNGEGIPDKIKEKMFELFATSKVHGVGLGLPISYEIIKAHKGELKFEDNKPTGTICSITLPV